MPSDVERGPSMSTWTLSKWQTGVVWQLLDTCMSLDHGMLTFMALLAPKPDVTFQSKHMKHLEIIICARWCAECLVHYFGKMG